VYRRKRRWYSIGMTIWRKHSRVIAAFLALVLFAPVFAAAQSITRGDIAIGRFWAYPAETDTAKYNAMLMQGMPSGPTIDVFGSIVNGGNLSEAITTITSPAFKAATIINWVRGAQYIQAFPLLLAPGKPLALGPQTQFLRLYGLGGSYKSGDRFPITLHFQHTPDATIDVIVQAK